VGLFAKSVKTCVIFTICELDGFIWEPLTYIFILLDIEP